MNSMERQQLELKNKRIQSEFSFETALDKTRYNRPQKKLLRNLFIKGLEIGLELEHVGEAIDFILYLFRHGLNFESVKKFILNRKFYKENYKPNRLKGFLKKAWFHIKKPFTKTPKTLINKGNNAK